jgi:hypothetical protein
MKAHRASILAALGAALFLLSVTRPAAAGVRVVDDLVITANTVLEPETYNVEDVKNDGVIQIAADNITLDGTGVVIQGVGFHGFGIRMNGLRQLRLRQRRLVLAAQFIRSHFFDGERLRPQLGE